ncbi:E3 ubiquitin/ISG15 ligase TRIM25-like isoform X1 [Pseudophryne corroboree]|uniref:E3 ubiquitin/ISG15 ligase TRIM25-like isoform X1 n=1 Tax=Pseudophryne corroboree TaxID=495146 RepID=UPI00308165BB
MFVRSRSAMATAAFLCSEYLYCPVCLDLFREPVTIPCGHTFCLACITQCWSLQGMPTSCPQCRSTFRPDSSPRLCKNSILSQMVEDFSNFQESSEGMTALSNQAKTVGMPFEDLCHQNLPDGSLESKTSNKFDLPPICRNSQEAISVQVSYAKQRRVVSQGFSDMARSLQASGFRLLQMLEQAESQVLKNVNSHELVEGLTMTAMQSAQVVPDQQQDQHVTAEEETSIQDHKWSGLYAAVSKFKECLLELCADHMGRLVQQVWTTHSSCPILQPKLWRSPLLPLIPRVRDEFLQYYRDISLDPDTAHHNLCLMQGNRRVLCKLQPQAYPEHPGRFNHYTQVLGREPMAHGRHYWEVCLSGNRVNLGVTYHDISRKGHQSYCLAGRNSQSWCLEWNSTRCYAWHDGQRVLVATGQQEKLGIFLDWDAGSLSFHEVSDNMLLLHQFHASFIQPVYPIFFISWNSIMSLGEGTSTHHSVNSNRFHRQLSANF